MFRSVEVCCSEAVKVFSGKVVLGHLRFIMAVMEWSVEVISVMLRPTGVS